MKTQQLTLKELQEREEADVDSSQIIYAGYTGLKERAPEQKREEGDVDSAQTIYDNYTGLAEAGGS